MGKKALMNVCLWGNMAETSYFFPKKVSYKCLKQNVS